jgi:hypothetical protein
MIEEPRPSHMRRVKGARMLTTANILAMIALTILGSAFLISGQFDDRSVNWVNLAFATICFIGAFLLRPHRSA